MKSSCSLFAVTLAFVFAAATHSQAGPFQYSYNWAVSPNSIDGSRGGDVVLTSNGGGTTNVAIDTAAANVTWFSSVTSPSSEILPPPPPGNPYSGNGSNYTLAVTLGDGVAGDPTGTITFKGWLGGSLNHESADLGNSITGVTDGTGNHIGQTFGVIDVDGTQFTVSYSGFTNPTLASPGKISFDISFAPEISGGHSAPEPSGMMLGCLGLMFLGGVAYRVHRRKAPAFNAVV